VITDTRIAIEQTISDSFSLQGILCVQCFVFSNIDIVTTLYVIDW